MSLSTFFVQIIKKKMSLSTLLIVPSYSSVPFTNKLQEKKNKLKLPTTAMASSTPPHFFKVILSYTLTQQKLEVPMKFVRLYGEALKSEEVWLKVVNGAMWKIGLEKSNQKVWLKKGWAEFVRFYSINIGHFIVFTYEGNSCFHVLIFDKTATGIEYPIASREFHNKKKFEEGKNIKGFQIMSLKREREEFEENRCAQILGNNKRSRKEDKNNNVAQILHSLTHKNMKRSDQAGGSKVICKKVELKKEDLHSSELKIDLIPFQERNKVKKPTIATQEARINNEKASKFKSLTKNPSFMVTIGSSYLHTGRGYVCIPIGFGNTHLRKNKELTLQVSDGNAWKVKCVERWYSNIQKFEMGNGWRKFARDNNLKEGDICVFELIKNIQISFKTTIFRLGL